MDIKAIVLSESDVPADFLKWFELVDDSDKPTIPCSVGDIFAGSGTSGMVAVSLGRAAVLVDISQEYLEKHVPNRTTVQMRLI